MGTAAHAGQARGVGFRTVLLAGAAAILCTACGSSETLPDPQQELLRQVAVDMAHDAVPVVLRPCLEEVASTDAGRRALARMRAGQALEAAQALLPLLAERPEVPETVTMHAWLLVQAGEASSALREVDATDPPPGSACVPALALVRAEALADTGRPGASLAWYRQAVGAAQDPKVLGAAARAALRAGEADWSADCLAALRAIRPLDASEQLLAARALTGAGRFAEARTAWDRVLEANAGQGRLWEEAGLAAFDEGEARQSTESFARAAECFRKALEGDPQNARAQFNLGCALDWSGDDEGAIAAYERALELRPDHVAAARNLVRALQRAGRTDAARAVLEQLLRQPLAPADATWVQETLAAFP